MNAPVRLLVEPASDVHGCELWLSKGLMPVTLCCGREPAPGWRRLFVEGESSTGLPSFPVGGGADVATPSWTAWAALLAAVERGELPEPLMVRLEGDDAAVKLASRAAADDWAHRVGALPGRWSPWDGSMRTYRTVAVEWHGWTVGLYAHEYQREVPRG